MSSTTLSTDRNPWITRGGIAVFAALAIGVLLSLGGSVRALGYGAPSCGGYHQTACKAQVGSVSTSPRTPTAGSGFAVSFKTTSGGSYKITALRKNAKSAVKLSDGATGTGTMTVKKLGKKLKAGSYTLTVKIASSGSPSAHASHALKIKRG